MENDTGQANGIRKLPVGGRGARPSKISPRCRKKCNRKRSKFLTPCLKKCRTRKCTNGCKNNANHRHAACKKGCPILSARKDDPKPPPDFKEIEGNVVAEVNLDDGMTVKFLEPDENILVVVADIFEGGKDPLTEYAAINGGKSINPVKFYKYLTKKKAVPYKLTAIYDRIKAIKLGPQPEPPDLPTIKTASDGSRRVSTSSSSKPVPWGSHRWWKNHLCTTGQKFEFCRCQLSRGGDQKLEVRSDDLNMAILPREGGLIYSLHYKYNPTNFLTGKTYCALGGMFTTNQYCKWKLLSAHWLTPSSPVKRYAIIHPGPDWYDFLIRIYTGPGARYHFSMYDTIDERVDCRQEGKNGCHTCPNVESRRIVEYKNPTYGSLPLNFCMKYPRRQCGISAANAFCRWQGHAKAVSYSKKYSSGPSRYFGEKIGRRAICRSKRFRCWIFYYIRCR